MSQSAEMTDGPQADTITRWPIVQGQT